MAIRISVNQAKKLFNKNGILILPVPKEKKYKNKEVVYYGILFPSQKEGNRYLILLDMLRKKQISGLELQVRFDLRVNLIKICTYIADFRYFNELTRETVVEDAKGKPTDVYRLKKKMMKAILNIEIFET